MKINLDEEIRLIKKELLEIDKEYKSYYKDLLFHDIENISTYRNVERVGLYTYYPYLFYDEFQSVSIETFRKIAISGLLCLKSILINDELIDSNDLIDPINLLHSNFLYRKCLNILSSLFISSSDFWCFFSKYNIEFTNAVLVERAKHFGMVSPFPFSEFEVIAKGKAAMAKYVTAALAVLSNKSQKIEKLEISQDYFNIGFQLYDDLKDWKKDYQNRNYSYLLTTIVYENQLTEEIKSYNPHNLETIGKMIYLSKAADDQLNRAIYSFHKAIENAKNCSLWLEKINESILRCQESKDGLVSTRYKLLSRENIKYKNINKKFISIHNEKLGYSFQQALDYILTQRKIDYPEMQHKIFIPKNKVFVSTYGQQTGDVFQRALLNDTLLDARNFFPNANEIIKEEVEKLATDKSTKVRGGWIYFPRLPEMPPDADCLGQVIQVLMRSKHKDTANLLSDPISLLLSDCRYDDGTFETWMIDNKDKSKNIKVIKNAVKKAWKLRKGKDNDAQANILYGLYLYDYKNLRTIIKTGTETLEKRQDSTGCWKSTWYFGNYYGTYVAIRIIRAVKPNSQTLIKAKQFLLNTQNYDGGWGNFGSDPLNTSLALLSLVLLRNVNFSCINRGINYLLSTQNRRGYWDKVEFIKMEYTYSTFAYRSKTITTQFCIKALTAIISNSYLEKKVDTSKENFSQPKIKVYPLYQGLKTILRKENSNDGTKKIRLIDSKYLTAKKDLNDSFPSINKNEFIKIITTYNRNDFLELTQKIKNENILEISKESIKRCFENLPMNKMPVIYLWIGDYSFLSESAMIQGTPSIIISLEFFANFKLSQKNKKQCYYNTRLHELKNSIPAIIANEYARGILKQKGISKNSFSDNLYEAGFATYFSKRVFPEFPLSYHLLITELEVEWCKRNEWFIKRELEPHIFGKNKSKVYTYFSNNCKTKNGWLPNRLGFYAGYRVIEEFLNHRYASTFRDLINESPFEVIPKSGFFNN